MEEIYKWEVHRKAGSIIHDPPHPLNSKFPLLPSGRRYSILNVRKARYKKKKNPQQLIYWDMNSYWLKPARVFIILFLMKYTVA